jgi:hypothetical protein
LPFALPAGPLLALEHGDAVLGGTNFAHLGLLVADHLSLLAALAAGAFLGRASNDVLHPLRCVGNA